MLVVATVNVEQLRHGGPERVGRRVHVRLHYAHVICVQENILPGGLEIPHFTEVARSVGETERCTCATAYL